jgi:hypothetical protein
MGTFGFGQVNKSEQLVLASKEVPRLRREKAALERKVAAWDAKNPAPSYYTAEYDSWREKREKAGIRAMDEQAEELQREINRKEQVLDPDRKEDWMKDEDEDPALLQLERATKLYREQPSLQTKLLVNEAFYKYLYIGSSKFKRGGNWADTINDEEFGYVATLLNPKADPLGRYLMCDVRIEDRLKQCLMALSGSIKPLILGETHPDPDEGCFGDYVRMHSSRPGGARVKGAGLGSTLYFGTMLGVTLYGGRPGVYSLDGASCGSGRLADADKLWPQLVSRGLAQEEEVEGGDEENEYEEETEVCVDIRRKHKDGYVEVYSSKDDYGTYTGTVCEDVEVSYTGSSRSDGGTAQYMTTDRLKRDPCIAYVCGGDNTLIGRKHVSTWEKPNDDAPRTNKEFERVYEAHWADVDTLKFPDKRTVEMLAASSHGPSPRLILFNAQAIKNSGHEKAEDLMVAYLTRPDIAPTIKNNQTAMELLGQQRLPGLSGLSRAAHREVMSAMRLGQTIDPNSDNPLRLPKKSAALLKLSSQYPED